MIALITASLLAGNKGAVEQLRASEVREMRQDNADLIFLDVRTEAEYNGSMGHIEGSKLIPLHELTLRLGELQKFSSQKIIVYCRSGRRSNIAAEILQKNGFNVANLIGGMLTWNRDKK